MGSQNPGLELCCNVGRNIIRWRRRILVFSLFFLLLVYVHLSKFYRGQPLVISEKDQGPIRFQISEIWAWNDDIISEPSPRLRHLNIVPESSKVKHDAVKRPPAVYGVYPGEREFDVEGLEDYILWFGTQAVAPKFNRYKKCKTPRTNVFFLKTHFTGSDVITSILNRYGDLNNLVFALPSHLRATFNWPLRFQWNFIDTNLLGGGLPSMLSNHARYNRGIVKTIMRPDAAFVTILRKPEGVFEDTFHSLEFARDFDLQEREDPFASFMINPKDTVLSVLRKRQFKPHLNLVKNPMFFDLGLSTADYHLTDAIRQAIEELDRQFDLVLIYEHLHESLVLFKRRMCWQMDDILFLKVHLPKHRAEAPKNRPQNLTQAIRLWNKADMDLYNYFNNTFWSSVAEEGPGFQTELQEFKQRLKEVEKDCLRPLENGTLVLNPQVGRNNRYFCQKLMRTEHEYLDYFRRKQKQLVLRKKKR